MNTKQFEAAADICDNAHKLRVLVSMEDADGNLDVPKLVVAFRRLCEMVRDMQP